MQYAGLGAGWDTEFIPEPLHQLVIDQQCLSGVAASGQRPHEQARSGLPERRSGCQLPARSFGSGQFTAEQRGAAAARQPILRRGSGPVDSPRAGSY